jgi:tRNA-splicing ligase RtcB
VPGSMGVRSFIVRGKGNPESFHSCAHGAGRRMSRTQARHRFKEADLVAQTIGVECRKDRAVLDELPQAYKDNEDSPQQATGYQKENLIMMRNHGFSNSSL